MVSQQKIGLSLSDNNNNNKKIYFPYISFCITRSLVIIIIKPAKTLIH